MTVQSKLYEEIQYVLRELFGSSPELQLQPTNREFEGSHTLVCFPLTKLSRKSPEETARLVGEKLVSTSTVVEKFNVVKGFLNLVIADKAWINEFAEVLHHHDYGTLPPDGKEIIVEYSSPNTNKPLHLGHLRNIFLGWSVSRLLTASGTKVHKVQIVNDRGIHICKSMAAWQLYGDGETPATSGIKGDHLVGKYYVEFDKAYKAQVKALIEKGSKEEDAERNAPIMKLAVDMLRKWEQKDPEILELWKTMNGWVYEGFDATYRRMGVSFDKLYYESETYLLGKEEVLRGLEQGVFFKKEDGSVWVDLTKDGLDEKVLLRADGTSVYITQDIGTAILRFRDFPNATGQIYTVGSEQEYHFKVLFLILDKLGYPWAKSCFHLSYGMVDLPTGRMKSREGTVVDADDLMEEMVREAETQTRELGKIEGLSSMEASKLFEMIGLGALKFFLLKVDPHKRMLFDPAESIQLQGFTGPFVQYTHARICAILRKAQEQGLQEDGGGLPGPSTLDASERDVLIRLSAFPNKILEAARDHSPAVIANYVYELAREYNQFYQAVPIFGEPDTAKQNFRVAFSSVTARVIRKAMDLLGIEVPERM